MRDRGSREPEGSEGREQVGPAPGKMPRSERVYGSGAPLPEGPKAQFESTLGTDLSAVRVHTGAESAQAAGELGAQAFTTGQDIHFGAGKYQPDDPFGMHLIAHEVAHTVQQGSGAASGPQLKGEDGASSDPHEVAADAAADKMAGDPRRKPVFVEFDKDGTWVGEDVLANLRNVPATVPAEFATAILEGRRIAALYIIDLRSAVSMAGADPARKDRCEQIAISLSNRINELTYATPSSPLTYVQLAEVAAWGGEYLGGADKPAAKAGEAAAPAGDPVEAHAAKLVGAGGAYAHEGKAEIFRKNVKPALAANDESAGEDATPPLPGWRFIRDPFDNTVVAVKPDGTGIQYTYDAVKSEEGVKLTLAHTDQLSELRVAVLARMDKAAMGEKQESEAGRKARIAADQKKGDEKRAEWALAHPVEAADYQTKLDTYNALSAADKKTTKPPLPPSGYPGNPTTTDCNLWCTPAYKDGGGKTDEVFPFTAPTKWDTFRTHADDKSGPKPGDVYWLEFRSGSGAHMGIFKSKTPAAGYPGQEMWVVTDGGQGGYTELQLVVEKTRGPYDPEKGEFPNTNDSGQLDGYRKLTGWVDIDAHHKKNQPADPPEST